MAQSRNVPDQGCNDCRDNDTLTQKIINRERGGVCTLLTDASGEVAKQEEKFTKENELYSLKKCMYLSTEDNFRRYRNLDITIGTELAQTNESVKANVATLNKWNKDLNAALKNIAKGVKDTKLKFNDLRKAANDLKGCMDDSCSKAQMKALTGKAKDCKDEVEIPDACKEAGTILDDLVCIPQGLGKDIDSLFNAAHEVVGIQVFSNIESLEPLQKELEGRSKSFKAHLTEVIKQREAELKTHQEELVKSVQDITKAALDRNSARSNFEGYYDALKFLCCPKCLCAKPEGNDDCEKCKPRLKGCEKEICRICDEVKVTFCCDAHKPPSTAQAST